ncbi:hypothetical protein B0H13DRAFT_1858448 [Mycena leptocephala]|nr:hypothetical protein B0H13DRAFT_1858448 [Mycena leptocephala]
MERPRGDFRVVKLGDLNLLDEIGKENAVAIRHKKTGVVVRHVKVVVGTRRVYRARIFGSQDPMTAAVYDNHRQFEQRITGMQEGPQFRHPHLAQFFGFTCLASMNALIYHDGLKLPLLVDLRLTRRGLVTCDNYSEALSIHSICYWLFIPGLRLGCQVAYPGFYLVCFGPSTGVVLGNCAGSAVRQNPAILKAFIPFVRVPHSPALIS